MLQLLIIQFPLYYLLSGRLWETKKIQTFSSKGGRGRYERWLLTRGYKYSEGDNRLDKIYTFCWPLVLMPSQLQVSMLPANFELERMTSQKYGLAANYS